MSGADDEEGGTMSGDEHAKELDRLRGKIDKAKKEKERQIKRLDIICGSEDMVIHRQETERTYEKICDDKIAPLAEQLRVLIAQRSAKKRKRKRRTDLPKNVDDQFSASSPTPKSKSEPNRKHVSLCSDNASYFSGNAAVDPIRNPDSTYPPSTSRNVLDEEAEMIGGVNRITESKRVDLKLLKDTEGSTNGMDSNAERLDDRERVVNQELGCDGGGNMIAPKISEKTANSTNDEYRAIDTSDLVSGGCENEQDRTALVSRRNDAITSTCESNLEPAEHAEAKGSDESLESEQISETNNNRQEKAALTNTLYSHIDSGDEEGAAFGGNDDNEIGEGGGREEGEEDEDEEEEDLTDETKNYHTSMMKSLTLIRQGFLRQFPTARPKKKKIQNKAMESPFVNLATVSYGGNTFHRNRCYLLKSDDGIKRTVGIKSFLANNKARCILIEKFENTILGMSDNEFVADYNLGTYVQIYKHVADVGLAMLRGESKDIEEIPSTIYLNQTPGRWRRFGYFNDTKYSRRRSLDRKILSMEAFAGAGGSLQGNHYAGIVTEFAIEIDSNACVTLKKNHPETKIYEGCIRNFIRDIDKYKWILEKIDHISFSSPCQYFSGLNRHKETSDRSLADLSLLLPVLVKHTSCSTAVFENVTGIWEPNTVHYLKNIAKELMKLGYQVKCEVLNACDYGDPQRRNRVIMLISKNGMSIPSFPAKTHGYDANQEAYVTVGDALSSGNMGSSPNMEGLKTTNKPGEHGIVRLIWDSVAPPIRASSTPPFHPEEDRLITWREAASLQSFPPNYIFKGSVRSIYRQIGNAVPIEMACAIARSIKEVYCRDYEDEK